MVASSYQCSITRTGAGQLWKHHQVGNSSSVILSTIATWAMSSRASDHHHRHRQTPRAQPQGQPAPPEGPPGAARGPTIHGLPPLQFPAQLRAIEVQVVEAQLLNRTGPGPMPCHGHEAMPWWLVKDELFMTMVDAWWLRMKYWRLRMKDWVLMVNKWWLSNESYWSSDGWFVIVSRCLQ